jgi:8-amino-7-oxononanoate synthase
MTDSLDTALAAELQARRTAGLYRKRALLESPQGSRVVLDGRECLAFSSNDYLGLANHPVVVEAFRHSASRYGVGSGASHLICGHGAEHHALEEELADFTGRSRALLFSTGYMANLGVIGALAERGDGVFEDRLNHASLLDGGLASKARFKRYRHADTADLDRHLRAAEVRRRLVVTDGVFSMDGDLAPLPELASVCADRNAWLMVDDAHGFGVLGESGGGVAGHFHLNQSQLPILMGTLGKGFGTFGAFVAGSDTLIDYLIQSARPYIYTTALPPAVAAASRASLKLIREESWRRDKLAVLIDRFRRGAGQLGLQLMASRTPIQPVIVGGDDEVMIVGRRLLERGIHVGTIRPPTVPRGSARLRITLSAAHEESDVDRLLIALDQAFRGIGP